MIIDIIGWEIGEAPRARQEGTHEDKGRARSQTAQIHYMNADVTLACERCYVTNGYLQRLLWDRSVFLKRDKKCYVFK